MCEQVPDDGKQCIAFIPSAQGELEVASCCMEVIQSQLAHMGILQGE
jgi:hypothetical protein